MSEPSTPPPPAKRRRTRHDQGIRPFRTPLPQSLYHLVAQDLRPRQSSSSPTRSSPGRPGSEAPITLEELKRRRLAYVKKNEADARRRRLSKGKEKEVDGQGDDELEDGAADEVGDEGEGSQVVRGQTESQMLDINVEDNLPSSELIHALHHYASHFYSSMSIIGTLQTPDEWAEFQRHRREERYKERSKREQNRFAEKALKKYREEESKATSQSSRAGSSTIGDNAEAGPSLSQGSPFKTQRGRSTVIATTYSQRSHPLDLVDPPDVVSTSQRQVDSQSNAGSDEQETEEDTTSEAGSQSTTGDGKAKALPASSSTIPGDISDNPVDGVTFQQEGLRLKNKWKREKRRDMRQAFNGSALMALGILIQEKTVSLLKEAGYVEDNEAETPGGGIDLDVLFPKALLGRTDSRKRKAAAVVTGAINGSVTGESPAKRKRGRPRLYPPKEPVNGK